MGWSPPSPPPRKAPSWRCMCEGCGAPVTDEQCSYCLRATGQTVNGAREALGLPPLYEVDVTCVEDSKPRYIPLRQPRNEWR